MKIAMVIVIGVVAIFAIVAAAIVVMDIIDEKEASYRRELELEEHKIKSNYYRRND